MLVEHPAIAEAAVVPSPDRVRHTVPKAFIVPAAGHQAISELAQIISTTPGSSGSVQEDRRLEFADMPRKTISGKIRRTELRDLEHRRHEAGSRGPFEFFEEDF